MSDDPNDLGDRLRRLGFRVRRDASAAFLAHVHKSRTGPIETVEQLLELEENARRAVSLARRTRFACLGSFKATDRFDAHPEKIDRPLVEKLLVLDFVQGENVLLEGRIGPRQDDDRAEPRAGRSRCGLHRWVLNARSHARRPTEPGIDAGIRATIAPLHPARSVDPRRARAPCRATRVRLTCSTTSSALDTSSARRSSRPTNLAFKQWGNTFPGAACVVALVGRFAQHWHRLEILGESYRDKHGSTPIYRSRRPPSHVASRREPVGVRSRRKRSSINKRGYPTPNQESGPAQTAILACGREAARCLPAGVASADGAKKWDCRVPRTVG